MLALLTLFFQGLTQSYSVAQSHRQGLILSSGFLCFSNHLGVLRALDKAGELTSTLGPIVGTSSGAIVGSLLASGLTVDEIAGILTARRPIALCRPSVRPWRGLFSASRLGDVLREVLPDSFEQLRMPFAVGVCRVGGTDATPVLLTEGPLVDAVLASCAVPAMFEPITIGGVKYVDGGIRDRTCAELSREWRAKVAPGCSAMLTHLIVDKPGVEFGPRDGIRDQRGMTIVRTQRTKQSLFSRAGQRFAEEVAAAEGLCAEALAARTLSADATS